MIKSLGHPTASPVELAKLRENMKSVPASAAEGGKASVGESATATPAARMASLGAPVDADRVALVKAAIARGEYPVDAARIADRMVEIDLPPKAS